MHDHAKDDATVFNVGGAIITVGGLGVAFDFTSTVAGTLVTLLSSLRVLFPGVDSGGDLGALASTLAPSAKERPV